MGVSHLVCPVWMSRLQWAGYQDTLTPKQDGPGNYSSPMDCDTSASETLQHPTVADKTQSVPPASERNRRLGSGRLPTISPRELLSSKHPESYLM